MVKKHKMNMIRWLSCVTLFVTIVAADYAEVFRDDFDGPDLDLTVWTPTEQAAEVNSELEYYVPDDVFLRDGNLVLRSQRRHYQSRLYTSGRVDTRGKYTFQYGEIEWRSKLPKGKGVWPALWLLQQECPAATPCSTWPPEIDVMEARGDVPNRVSHALHYGLFPNNGFDTTEIFRADFSADFHVFKSRWEPGVIRWYVDGEETFKVENNVTVPAEPMQIIMNVAVGGTYSGFPDEYTVFPTEMLIDYVVVRQNV